jgi:eukaryotic-like serine/threonine-protein kinase
MAFRIEPHAEPIPGYTLIERLGGGGFGEVWKAEAPGGLHKAIKFVYGDLQSQDDTDGNRAEQELKALSRVKSVHHPYILSLERYDIINGQLVIVMELADRTLWDRFKESRSQGLPGIPRNELLEYMRETAEALDLMNQQFQLQHLDIKPQNLFLVFNHIKVADFGLVKDLGTMAAATVTGGVTPVYAAPETFDGWLSRFSDQYSLAIVYQELLTGQRPFTGSTVRQLVMQHLQGEPDLTLLPTADRPAVSRALAKNPEERFATCVDFVLALRNAAAPRSASAAPSHDDDLAALADTPGDLDAAPSSADTRETRRGRPDQWHDEPEDGIVSPNRPNVLPPRPDKVVVDTPSPGYHEEEGHLDSMPRTCLQRPRPVDPEAILTPPSEDGVTQPALVIGLGKLGIHTLVHLRRQITQEFGHPEALPQVRMLAIDVDPATLHAASRGEPRAVLRNHELALARLHRPSHYLHMRDRDGKLVTDTWLNSKLLYRIPKQANGAALRALARLALLDNYRTLSQRLEAELLACVAPDTLQEMSQTGLGIRSTLPRVYVVCGLGGNTGSGMFLDVAYGVRQLLRKHGYGRAEIVGLFFLPDLAAETNAVALTQTYAALAELKHYASGHEVFTAIYPRDDRQLSEAGSPFQRCRFLTLPKPKTATIAAENVPETVTLAGQFLYRDLVTPLGKSLDAALASALAQPPGDGGPAWHTFGLHRVVWPRKRLLERAAVLLGKRVVERWMSKDAKDQSARLSQWAQEQWEAQGLRPEALITRNLQECEKKLKRPPEQMIQEALAPLAKALAPAGSKSAATSVNAAPVVSAFAALEKILGVPEECRDNNLTSPEPSVIERALKEAGTAIGDHADQKLTELIVKLIEEPAFRLAGAEEALRQFSTVAEQSLRSQEILGKELGDRAAVLYARIHTLIESPNQPITQSNTIWKLGFSRKTPTSNPRLGIDLLELIRLYAKTRFQSLILSQVNKQYVGLRGHFSDQIREVGFCRTRLGELLGLLGDKPAGAPAATGQAAAGPAAGLPAAASFERLLLPTGCVKLDDAVQRLDGNISADDLLAFDKIIQALMRHQYRALLNVCMGPSNLVRTLAPQILHEAAKYLAQQVDGEGVADLWLTANPDEYAVRDQLLAAFDAAAPNFDATRHPDEVTVAVLPAGDKGELLAEQTAIALPSAHVAASDRTDEIIFYREYSRLELSDLEQFGPEAERLYRQRSAVDPSSVHFREDLPFTQPLAAAQ